MSLTTGTPLGTINSQSEIYVESAPYVYYQDSNGYYAKNPDSDGFYTGLSGTSTYPVYQLGCFSDVSISDNLDVNQVRCDAIGDKDVIIKRNYIEVTLTLKSFFPLKNISALLNAGTVTQNLTEHTEKMGMGVVDNNKYYRVYMPKVYDETAGDYVSFTIHRAKFVSQGGISLSYGNVWSMPITIRALADETKPSAQQFMTVLRADLSAI
jgi:hypothetical protein